MTQDQKTIKVLYIGGIVGSGSTLKVSLGLMGLPLLSRFGYQK